MGPFRFSRRPPGGFAPPVAWTRPGGAPVPRYYPIYSPGEFAADLSAGALATRRSEISSGNCYAVVAPETA